MNGMLYLYCRVREELRAYGRRLTVREEMIGEAGLSNLAIAVILLGVGVALVLAVVYVIGPAIIRLANNTGNQIDSVPLDWGQ